MAPRKPRSITASVQAAIKAMHWLTDADAVDLDLTYAEAWCVASAPSWTLPGEWAGEGSVHDAGPENWESLPAPDRRAVCAAGPVLETCQRWASA